MNFDLDSFFLGSNTNKSKDSIRYYYSSNDFTCLLFICMKEFMNYKNKQKTKVKKSKFKNKMKAKKFKFKFKGE